MVTIVEAPSSPEAALFRVIAALEAAAAAARVAERAVSAEHQPLAAAAFLESVTLCENGLDAAYAMLRGRGLLRAFSPAEAASAAPFAFSAPASDYSAAKTLLRGMHAALAETWQAVPLSGADAVSAAAFAAAHTALATRLGFQNGLPEIA